MIRANERIRHALLGVHTAEVEISYHCRGCKGYFTSSVPTRSLGRTRCRCGADDLLLLSVQQEPSSPLIRTNGLQAAAG